MSFSTMVGTCMLETSSKGPSGNAENREAPGVVSHLDEINLEYTVLEWLSGVSARAGAGSHETIKQIGDLAMCIPDRGDLPPEVQRVVDSVKKTGKTRKFDPELSRLTSRAIEVIRLQPKPTIGSLRSKFKD